MDDVLLVVLLFACLIAGLVLVPFGLPRGRIAVASQVLNQLCAGYDPAHLENHRTLPIFSARP